MTTKERPYYSIAEAARLLNVSRSTVWRWIAAGRLQAHRLGPKTIRIAKDDLQGLIQPARPQPPPLEPSRVSMTLEEAKLFLATPPTPADLARRAAVVARILEHRKEINIAPLTTADLIHMVREEEEQAYGKPRGNDGGRRFGSDEVAPDGRG